MLPLRGCGSDRIAEAPIPPAPGSQPDTLRVISTAAMKGALVELAPAFERVFGARLVIEFASTSLARERIDGGEPFDVVIVSTQLIAHCAARRADAFGERRAFVGSTFASLAYRSGSPAPDVSSAVALTRALLDAASISYSDPAAGGASSTYFAALLDRLGVAEPVGRKAVLTRPGDGAVPVGAGRTALGVAQASEAAMVPGVSCVALSPSDPNSRSSYGAAVSGVSRQACAALAFLEFLGSASARALLETKGFVPH